MEIQEGPLYDSNVSIDRDLHLFLGIMGRGLEKGR